MRWKGEVLHLSFHSCFNWIIAITGTCTLRFQHGPRWKTEMESCNHRDFSLPVVTLPLSSIEVFFKVENVMTKRSQWMALGNLNGKLPLDMKVSMRKRVRLTVWAYRGCHQLAVQNEAGSHLFDAWKERVGMGLWWAIKDFESEGKASVINQRCHGRLRLSMKHPLGNIFM